MRPGWLEVPAADPHERPSRPRAARLLVFVADRGTACPEHCGSGAAGIALDPGLALSFQNWEIRHLGVPGGISGREPWVRPCLGLSRADPRYRPALDIHQLDLALSAGRHAVERAKLAGMDLVAARSLCLAGPGATLALACAVTGEDPEESRSWVGVAYPPPAVEAEDDPPHPPFVRAALARHAGHLGDPYEALRRLGGVELAALVGTCLACAQLGVVFRPLGYPAEVAALVAGRLNSGVGYWVAADGKPVLGDNPDGRGSTRCGHVSFPASDRGVLCP